MRKGISIGISLIGLIVGFGSTGAGVPHTFLTEYEGPSTCLGCHGEGSLSPVSIDEITASVHYQWRTENPNVGIPGGGSHGMIDRACGLRGTNSIINFHTSNCGQCHIGKDLPFPDPATGRQTQAQLDGIDCLICHAREYDMNNDGVYHATETAEYRVRVPDPVFGEVWFQDRSLRAAQSVGEKIQAEQCLRCHEHGLNSCTYKRGAPFTPERDVHAAAGMDCIDCHQVEKHQFARGSRVTDMHGWERMDVEVACSNASCHGDTPHSDSILNQHFEHIACETCHIPYAAGVERQVWAPTFGVTEGPEADVPIYNEETGRYEPYINIQDDPLSVPVYKWFSGQVSFLAEPLEDAWAFDNVPPSRETPGAKIQPFRNLINGMIMDKNGMAMFGPDTPNPNYDPRWTYLGFIDSASQFFIQAGFMRPEGLNEKERAFLGQFPNLLLFDQAKYYETGDIPAAINLGLGRLGAYMQGMNPFSMTEQELTAIGSQMWSGEYVGLDLPNNPLDPMYIEDNDPTTNVGSFITISHAVTKDGALNCTDCHSKNGRLDFKALGYSEEQVAKLESVPHDTLIEAAGGYNGPSTCLSCHGDAVLDEIHQSVHYRFDSKLPEGYQYDAAGELVSFATSGKLWKLCGFPTSFPQINWIGNLRDLPETDYIDRPGGCAKCHVGIGLKPYTALNQSAPGPNDDINVDCLVCHAREYNRKYYTAILNGSPELNDQGMPVILSVPKVNGVLQWDVYEDAAKTVGRTSTETCLRCHIAAGGGKFQTDDHNYASFKRGNVFAEGKDVHYDAGMTCSDCHYAGNHKMKRPVNNDLSAHDVVVDHQMCTDCHGEQPHPGDKDMYNDHTAYISCTACHSQYFGGATLKDFSVTVPPDPDDPLGIYTVKIEFATPDLGAVFRWFNGTIEPEIFPRGSRGDGRIYPYKPVTFIQPLDADGNPIPIKWGLFFKTGDMMAAVETGRNLYASMYSEDLSAKYGIPPVPGPFDHFGQTEHPCGGFSISHSITKIDALRCASCHNPNSVLDFKDLGYTEEETTRLENLLDLPPMGDLDRDGVVGPEDLLIFQTYWKKSEEKMIQSLKKR